MGLSDFAKQRNPAKPFEVHPEGASVKRTRLTFDPIPGIPQVRALCTTAGPIFDTWSRRTVSTHTEQVVPVICPGGGPQIFSIAAKNSFNLTPGQDQQLTVDQKYEAALKRNMVQKTDPDISRPLQNASLAIFLLREDR